MSTEDIQDQLSHYISFIDKILKPKLQNAESEARVFKTEIASYEKLSSRLKDRMASNQIEEPIESMVDIGYKTVFCNAVAKRPSRVFVKVGMGFHIEMTPEEAIKFSKKRISYLRKYKLEGKESEIKEIKGHIQSASMILDQLHVELNRS